MRWLRLEDLIKKLGLGKTAIYALIKDQGFPKGRKIKGTTAVVWIESEVEAWMAEGLEA